MRRVISPILAAVLAITAFGLVASTDRSPASAAVPGAVTVDERAEGFTAKGFGWRSDDVGYADHHYWATTSRRARLVGIWRADLDPGTYRVLAKVPGKHASTRKALYRIRTADGWVRRVRDQSKNRKRWMVLGTHSFADRAEVRLSDQTRDPRRMVAFDAVRFVPVVAPTPTPTPAPTMTPAPTPTPAPPVIRNIDVEPRHDRLIVRFSLDDPGPAGTEYREAGAVTWLAGPDETSSDYADHRQVVKGLAALTAYELRVIATNAGGRTVSEIVRSTTLAPPPPTISDIDIEAQTFRAIVTFRLDAEGPARTEYREVGEEAWVAGAEEESSKYRDHRQVITGLRPETRYELRVIATNAGGEAISDIRRFTTEQRTVDCGSGDDLQAAIDAAREGDTLRIRGGCTFDSIGKDLTLRGVSAGGGVFTDRGEVGSGASVEFHDLGFGHDGFRNRGQLLLDGVEASFMIALDNDAGATLVLRNSTLTCSEPCVDNSGTFTAVDSRISAGQRGHAIYNGAGAELILRDTVLRTQLTLSNGGAATLRGVTLSGSNPDLPAEPIHNSGVMTIADSTFADNAQTWHTPEAPSVLGNSGQLTIIDSAFLRNEGGLGAILNTGDISLTRVTFSGNVPTDCVGC